MTNDNIINFDRKQPTYNGLPVAFIHLTYGFIAMIDKEDEEAALELSESYHLNEIKKSEYARGTDMWGKLFYLSRAIMNCSDPEMEVDYLDGNTMNLTKKNLHICTHKENAQIKIAREAFLLKGGKFERVCKNFLTNL